MGMLDTASSVVGLASTGMEIAGWFGIDLPGQDKPRWDEVLAKLDQALDAIGAVDGKLDTALDMISELGADMRQGFDELSGEISNVSDQIDDTRIGLAIGKAKGANDTMIQALAATDPIQKANLLTTALSNSNEAIRLVSQFSQTADGGLYVGAIVSVTVMQIAVVEELADGAFALEPFKGQMQEAADQLRTCIGQLIEDMEAKGGTFERHYYDGPPFNDRFDQLRFTNLTGTWSTESLAYTDWNSDDSDAATTPLLNEIMAAAASNGIAGVRAFVASATDEQIQAAGVPSPNSWRSWMEYNLNEARGYDLEASGLQGLLDMAGRWDWLVSGDHIEGAETADTLTANDADGIYRDVLDGYAGNDTLTGGAADNAVRGGDGNDLLYGLGGHDVLRGGDGDDVLIGGEGGDTIDGGVGIDTAHYAAAGGGVTVDLNKTTAQDTGQGKDTLSGIENLVGSAFNDVLTGNAGANRLNGYTGNDSLVGGDGGDTLLGGAGLDTMAGGVGTDLVDYTGDARNLQLKMTGAQAGNVYVVNGAALTFEDKVTEVENVTGGSGNDNFLGDGKANQLAGGAGNDTLDGGLGADRLYGDDKAVTAVDGADAIMGNAGDDIIDRMSAGNGVDTISGGEGRDTFVLTYKSGNAADIVTDFQAGFGGDFVNLNGFGKKDAADGFASGLFRLVQVGADTLLQYDTDRTLGVNYKTALVLQNLSARILVAGNFAPTGMFEQKGWDLYGAAGNDAVIGTAFAEKIDGSSGDDLLQGLAGVDTLDGGLGRDTVDFREKTEALKLTLNGATQVQVKVGSALEDFLKNVENVFGGTKADTLKGDGEANLFRGGAGADTLDGAGGSDIADYSDKTRAVVVTRNGGADAVVSVNGANEDVIRNIEGVYGGSGADTLTGDGLDNVLKGGGAADVLTGGAGRDVFTYDSILDSTANGVGRDRITDFHRAEDDRIDLRGIDADISTADVNDAFHYVKKFTGDAGEVMVKKDAAGLWLVRGDIDGDGAADFSISVASPDNLITGDFIF